MMIAIAGASGLIGSALADDLRADGHDVVRLVRRPARSADEVSWDPKAGTVDVDGLAGVEAVVNLAGAGVGDKRWTDSYKEEIRSSRVDGTRTLAQAIARLDPKPRVFVAGSAQGYYGDTGDTAVDETGPQGEGFLAEVVREWEAAADPAREAGIRVVHPRTGLVVSGEGGAWGRLFPIFRLGLGGNIGNGRQWWSWISMRDEIRAIRHLIDSDLEGPVNLTAPQPRRQSEVADAMGRVLHRPTFVPAPAFGLRILLGEFSSDILMSQRVLPAVLQKDGFTFEHTEIDDAIRAALS